MAIPFIKMEAAGNDFVVLDKRDGSSADGHALALAVCERNFGIGADGLLLIGPSAVADARMRMFNPDGTEDMCGNGLRCVTVLLLQGKSGSLRIETIAGTMPCQSDSPGQATVRFPPASFLARDLPANVESERLWDCPLALEGREFRLFGASTGTPHVVIFEDEVVSDAQVAGWGPLIENHPIFPERTSVSWVRMEGKNVLHARVWERGVGETLACGTGACAIAAIAFQRGLTEPSVNVSMRGGSLYVQICEDRTILLTGPARVVFRGTGEL